MVGAGARARAYANGKRMFQNVQGSVAEEPGTANNCMDGGSAPNAHNRYRHRLSSQD